MKYEVKELGGIYWVTFENGVSFRFERLYEDSHGRLTAEIWVRHSGLAPADHILQETTTISSGGSSTRLTNACKRRYDFEGADWVAMWEIARLKVLAMHREGDPVVDLNTVQESDGLKFQIEPFLFSGQANLMFGDGGIGKSLLACYMAVCTQLGISNSMLTCEPTNVLYLDWEASRDEAADRYRAVCRGLNLSPPWPTVMYRFCSSSLAGDIQPIRQMVGDLDIGLVIVDSAAPAVGGDPQDSGLTTQYFTALRSLEVTTLTIAHVRKESAERGGYATPFGSIFWRNLPRSNWMIQSISENDSDILNLGMRHTKVNNGPRSEPRAFNIEFGVDDFEKDVVRFKMGKASDTPAFAGMDTWRQMAAVLLEEQPLSRKEIYARMKAKGSTSPEQTVKTLLSAKVYGKKHKWAGARVFASLGNELYGLAQPDESVPIEAQMVFDEPVPEPPESGGVASPSELGF